MSFGHGTWYLQSLEQDGVSFVAGRAFTAVYTSTMTSVVWTTSTNCTQSGSNTPVTITCSQPGVETMTVTRNADSSTTDTFYVTVSQQLGCYKWFINLGSREVVDSGASINARIWIVDPANLSSEESSGTASSPSTTSKSLTNGFRNMGESPKLEFLSNQLGLSKNVSFSASDSYWQASLRALDPGSFPYRIKGNSVAIVGCGVEPFDSILSVKQPIQSSWLASTSASSTSSSFFTMHRNPCAKNIAFARSALYGSGNVAITQSSFLVSSETMLSQSFNLDSNGILSVALTPVGTAILTANGVRFLKLSSTTSSSAAAGIPSTAQLTSLRSAEICDTPSSTLSKHVVGWRSSPGTSTFYFSFDGGANFSPFNLANRLDSGGSAYIRDILPSQNLNKYIVLVRDGVNDKVFLVDPFLLSVLSGYSFGNPGMAVDSGQGATPFITEGPGSILFGGDALFLSPDFGRTMFAFTLKSRNPSLPATNLASGEWISQAVISPDGSVFAVLTSTFRVFYGSLGDPKALEVAAGISSTALLSFDVNQRLLVHQPSSTGNFVNTRIISIPNEMISPRAPITSNPTLVCPFKSWSTDLLPQYTVDIGENITIVANLTVTNAVSGDVMISYSNYSLIKLTSSQTLVNDYTPFGATERIITSNTAIKISPADRSLFGASQLSIRPREGNLACPKLQHVSSITVGCPSTRRMVLRNPTNPPPTNGTKQPPIDCSTAPTTVLLNPGQWVSDWTSVSRPNYEKYISYNCSQYGVPVEAYYGIPFVPMFDIFDGSVYVKTVTGNFGVWEVNGKPVDYNLTNGEAGCTGPAQTWMSMAASASGADPIAAWNSSNFVSCFNSTGPVDSNAKYTIFNSSNYLGIMWNGARDGVFMFTAKVLDPDYSYCSLTSDFAINVYGAPITPLVQAGVVIGLSALFILSLVATYFWYLRERRREAHERELAEENESENEDDGAEDGEDGGLWKEKLE
ncbi:hypothetical protein HDU80_007539 [Chytriomyces hyalinus]|nr:hypothetical protein HDU80_007539 [Chytriomyces hyalinus]